MKQEIKYNNIVVYATIALMLVMMFLRNGFDLPISPSMILVVSIIPAFWVTPSQMLAIAVSLIPMAAGFQYKYALLAYIVIGVFRNKRSLHLSGTIVPLILMMIWEYAHHIGGTFLLNEYFRGFAELFFIIFISCMRWDKIDFKIIARALALATIGIAVVIIYIQMTKGGMGWLEILAQKNENERFGVGTTEAENFGLNFNPNAMGFICNMSIVSLAILIVRREYNIADIIMLCLCVLIGFFTLSRTFVVCMFFIAICFVLVSPGSSRTRFLRLFLLLTLSFIILWIITMYLPSIMEAFMVRMDEKDLSNGRDFLWTFYNKHIFSSFEYCVFGIGLQNFGGTIAKLYGPHINVCHNGFQEVWLLWGVVGVLLFIWLFIALLKESKRWSGRRPFFALVPFFCLLLSSMAGQFLSSNHMIFSLALVYIILCLQWDKRVLKK